MTSLTDVYQEWQNNPEFREAFKNNPARALETKGYNLSAEDIKKILKFRDDNEQLDDRIIK